MSIRSPASDNEIRQWREGYRHHLIEKGILPSAAWDIAIKTPYRADLYPETGNDQSVSSGTARARARWV